MAYSLRQLEKIRTVDLVLWFTAACICACNLAVSLAHAQQRRQRYLVSPSRIVGEMLNHQLPTNGVQVRLAAPITAASENPVLEIQSVSLLNAHEIRLRMACRDRSECLPFLATATFPEELSSTSVPAKTVNGPVGKMVLVSSTRAGDQSTSATASVKPTLPPVVHSGSPSTLEFDEERLHIRIEVICLEGGAAGDQIYVISRDRKQTYVATIITPTLLKGVF